MAVTKCRRLIELNGAFILKVVSEMGCSNPRYLPNSEDETIDSNEDILIVVDAGVDTTLMSLCEITDKLSCIGKFLVLSSAGLPKQGLSKAIAIDETKVNPTYGEAVSGAFLEWKSLIHVAPDSPFWSVATSTSDQEPTSLIRSTDLLVEIENLLKEGDHSKFHPDFVKVLAEREKVSRLACLIGNLFEHESETTLSGRYDATHVGTSACLLMANLLARIETNVRDITLIFSTINLLREEIWGKEVAPSISDQPWVALADISVVNGDLNPPVGAFNRPIVFIDRDVRKKKQDALKAFAELLDVFVAKYLPTVLEWMEPCGGLLQVVDSLTLAEQEACVQLVYMAIRIGRWPTNQGQEPPKNVLLRPVTSIDRSAVNTFIKSQLKAFRLEQTRTVGSFSERHRSDWTFFRHYSELSSTATFCLELMGPCKEGEQASSEKDEQAENKETDPLPDVANGLFCIVCKDQPVPGNDRDSKESLKRLAKLCEPLPLVPMPSLQQLQESRQLLLQSYPWAEEAIDVILSPVFAKCRMGVATLKLEPTLLVGQPGSGKSRLAQDVCKMLNLAPHLISVGGAGDAKMISGTSRGWSSGQESLVAAKMVQSETASIAMVIDEIDKARGSLENGRLLDYLLAVMEPSTWSSIFDPYMQTACDFSHVSWLATSNSYQSLPLPLRSRMRVALVRQPQVEHLPALANGMIADVAKQYGWPLEALPDSLELGILDGLSATPSSARLLRRLVDESIGEWVANRTVH